MKIADIERRTRVLNAPKDWDGEKLPCDALPIADVVCEGVPFMVSAWLPTAEELAALNRGERVRLWIQGTAHPVVAVTVEPLEFANDAA